MKEESAARKILRSEITWTITMVVAVIGCVKMIILPINSLQILTAQVIAQLNEQKNYETRISRSETNIELLAQKGGVILIK